MAETEKKPKTYYQPTDEDRRRDDFLMATPDHQEYTASIIKEENEGKKENKNE
jgi:hypothetical protein